MARTVRLYRWRPTGGENFGDWLTVPLLKAMGYGVVDARPDKPCLFACGSILHEPHYSKSGGAPIHVWGSGLGKAGDEPKDAVFHAVRGPLTAEMLGIDVPLGDPALLFPRLVKLPVDPMELYELYVNHCWTQPPVKPMGFHMAVSCLNAGLDVVLYIAKARFVASESLHGCILAAAYDVPWAPMAPTGFPARQSRVEFKWQDWMAYLGLPPLVEFPRTYDEAKLWWEKVGHKGQLRDTEPLLRAFPGEFVCC